MITSSIFWKHHHMLLNTLINPSFYHGGYFFFNNIWDIGLCFAKTKMNIHNHYTFEISLCKRFSGLWADTYTNKLSKSWQLDETPPGFLQSLFSHLCCLFLMQSLVSDGQKYIYSISCCDIPSQQTGTVGVRLQSKRSLSHKKKRFN